MSDGASHGPATVGTDGVALPALGDHFADLACLTYGNDNVDRRRAAELWLAEKPALVTASLAAAAAVADVAAVRAFLDRAPAAATAPTGPRAWAPLLYLCYSRVNAAWPAGDVLACARLLLERGADANTRFLSHGKYVFTALAGVMGEGEGGPIAQPPHLQARALATLLLDAGANPDESQGLYDTHFNPSNDWLELLLARGLAPGKPANWDPDGASTIDYLLGQACVQGNLERVRLLLDHGGAANGRNHYNKRTLVENALLCGHAAIAAMLVRAGAALPTFTPGEAFQVAVLGGDEAEARRLLASHPEVRARTETLNAAAEHGPVTAVRLGLALGLPISGAHPRDGLTPLHHAARAGHPEVARELVARGARLDARDPVYGGRPIGHAEHFNRAHPSPGRAEVLRLLLGHEGDPFVLHRFGETARLTMLASGDAVAAQVVRALALLESAYLAFNARDIEAVLALMDPAVEWPNALDGGHVVGADEVRAYWTKQWQSLDPKVTPVDFLRGKGAPGELVIEALVEQVVRKVTGELVLVRKVRHTYRFAGERIKRMDIGQADS